jgi:hypothetical protein
MWAIPRSLRSISAKQVVHPRAPLFLRRGAQRLAVAPVNTGRESTALSDRNGGASGRLGLANRRPVHFELHDPDTQEPYTHVSSSTTRFRNGHARSTHYRLCHVSERRARALLGGPQATANQGVRRALGYLRARSCPDGLESRQARTLLVLHTRTRARVRCGDLGDRSEVGIPRGPSQIRDDAKQLPAIWRGAVSKFGSWPATAESSPQPEVSAGLPFTSGAAARRGSRQVWKRRGISNPQACSRSSRRHQKVA